MDDNHEYRSIWIAIGRFMDQHELHRLFDRERQRMYCHNRSMEKYRAMQESQEHSKAMQQALATKRPWRFWSPRSRSPPAGDALPPAPSCDSYSHPLLCLKGLNAFIYTERCSDLIKSKIMEESKEEKEKDESVDKEGLPGRARNYCPIGELQVASNELWFRSFVKNITFGFKDTFEELCRELFD